MAAKSRSAADIAAKKLVRPRLRITYPLVEGLRHSAAEKAMNAAVLRQVYDMLAELGYAHEPGMEVTGGYNVMLNRNGLLSLTLENYAYTYGAAHGLTLQRAVTADLERGAIYRLRELFRADGGCRAALSEIVKRRIEEQGIPLVREFREIGEEQDYYLTDTGVAIFFQLYAYTPYVYGIPVIEIPFAQLHGPIDKQGPLPQLTE